MWIELSFRWYFRCCCCFLFCSYSPSNNHSKIKNFLTKHKSNACSEATQASLTQTWVTNLHCEELNICFRPDLAKIIHTLPIKDGRSQMFFSPPVLCVWLCVRRCCVCGISPPPSTTAERKDDKSNYGGDKQWQSLAKKTLQQLLVAALSACWLRPKLLHRALHLPLLTGTATRAEMKVCRVLLIQQLVTDALPSLHAPVEETQFTIYTALYFLLKFCITFHRYMTSYRPSWRDSGCKLWRCIRWQSRVRHSRFPSTGVWFGSASFSAPFHPVCSCKRENF